MPCRNLLTVVTTLILLTAAAARAEVKVVIDRSDAAEFQENGVPAPSQNDAASKAKFSLIDGRRDSNSGPLEVLRDGRLPTKGDQPESNFFFDQKLDGGRIAIDLGHAIDVKQVNTYSWHPGRRGPQVYTLYAADGLARDFDGQPKKGREPTKCGWRLLTAVDTRPKSGEGGGLYGVSIADSVGIIGKYRYLLFDIFQTENDDSFGNTFYSEIDVVDADGPATVSTPDVKVRLLSKSPVSAPYQITIDFTDATDLKDWIQTTLQPAMDEWYPVVVEALPSDGYTAPAKLSIAFTSDYRGVAATTGTRVVCDVEWFRKERDGQAVGALVHELVHVVQQYGKTRGASGNPGWLVEGIADYIRWFKYEPIPSGTRPENLKKAKYTDSYRVTAGFLAYVVDKHDKQIIAKLNASMRQGKYRDELWKQHTGKTLDELWDDYIATLRESRTESRRHP